MTSVLIVEDDNDLRQLLMAALQSRGLGVLEAGDIEPAELALQNHSVTLIVIDGLLPSGSGIGLIERIRVVDRTTPIVFMSGHFRDLETFHRLTNELGVSMVVYKPIDPMQLSLRIGALLQLPQAQPVAPKRSVQELKTLEQMNALQVDFALRLPQRIEDLANAIKCAQNVPGHLAIARSLAHRLRGTAGSFGYPAVGEAAGVIEDRLDEIIDQGGSRRFQWERLTTAMQDATIAGRFAPQRDRQPDQDAKLQRRILVVSRDAEFLKTVSMVARKSLLHVLHANGASDSIAHAQHFTLMALVVDIELGEEESLALVRDVLATAGNGTISIAVASSDRRIETRVAAVQAGATRFFEKPIGETEFTEVLLQILSEAATQRGHVLIVDDDPDCIDYYSHCLGAAGYVVESLPNADHLVVKLEEINFDALLLDVNLPNISGIDVCRALRMSNRWTLLPIVIVTANGDTDTRLRAFRSGASDVIAKPILNEELLARVEVQTERMRLLRDRADKDALSGLLLRRATLEAFQRALATSERDGKRLSIVLFDIDHFKAVNDEYGHLAGDRVIAALGDLMRRRFRVEDLRGRWGGEEFLLVLPGAGKEFAREAAQRLLDDFAEMVFQSDDHRPFHATFTAGVAEYPSDGNSIATLIRSADESLYAGKHGGRRQVVTKAETRST